MNSKIIIPVAVIISVIVTAGIMYSIGFDQQQPQVSQVSSSPEVIDVGNSTSEFFDGTHDIRKISSQEELERIIDASAFLGGNSYDSRIGAPDIMMSGEEAMFEMDESTLELSMQTPMPAITKAESGDSEYSTTNVQVENVDEPDYIKNDSKYVYIVSKNTLSI
ncbi:MAG: beta-propeller domain-containing protein, partial [Nitrosopumilus sp.]